MLIKYEKNKNSHTLLVKIQTNITSVEGNSAISSKVKHIHSLSSSNSTFRAIPHRSSHKCGQGDMQRPCTAALFTKAKN